ncbi:MAG: hypothetical protein IPO21_17785 [Bacteroidales bacterium]|nr:hypothetical protein [Bacteroidales bacterium]
MKNYLVAFFLLSFFSTQSIAQNNTENIVLMLEFKEPITKNATAFTGLVSQKLYYSTVHNYFYIFVSEQELYSIFNLEITQTTVTGAGNCVNTDAHYSTIKDKTKLSARFQTYLNNVYIENDPKFLVVDEAQLYNSGN